MKTISFLTSGAAALAFSGLAAAAGVDCSKFAAHAPGYCGVTSNDVACNAPSNRVPGKCAIAASAVDCTSPYMPPKPGYCGLTSNVVLSKQAVSLLPSKTVGGVQLVQHNGQWMKLVAAGAGNYNLVAAGAGN